ncbi:MAG: DNA gyrase subunit A [Candidatus Woesearchaeota archaeon]
MEEKNIKENLSEIIPVEITDEVKSSYLDYAMSVIVSRALPDVRDGLKPVQRRILYSAKELSLYHNQPYKKSARLVGEVLGKYHPHGDSAIYEAIVRMAQPFSLRYPLIDGQGNFGSIDGDDAAAMRYTEVRLSRIAEEMLEDLDKETVAFVPNFDNTLEEPTVLPSKIPNLLLNGVNGIAVGMATNIPPHNLNEVCDAIIEIIKNPEIDIISLTKIIKGPDFPTGGIIEGKDGILNAYSTGKGKIVLSCKYHFEQNKNKEFIIIDEIPYQTSKADIIKEIAELAKNNEIEINEIRDESDRKHGIRIVIEVEKGKDINIVLNKILAKTKLRTTYNILMLGLVNNQPKILNLKEILIHFINHRVEIIKRRTEFLKKKAEERLHIVDGLVKATDKIDLTINILKNSNDVQEAIEKLKQELNIDEIQAKAILDMKLQRIIALERNKLVEEKNNLEKDIIQYKEILGSKERINQIIIDELTTIKEKYGDSRKTEIKDFVENLEIEDLIHDEAIAIVIDDKGFIKRIPLEDLKISSRQDRSKDRINENVTNIIITSTKQNIFLMTKSGKIFIRKAYVIENASKKARGNHLNNILNIKDDPVVAICNVGSEIDPSKYLFIVTNLGYVKKVKLEEFSNLKNSGIKAISLNENEYVKKMFIIDKNDDIVITTKNGKFIRFDQEEVSELGRNAHGVIGIRMEENDEIINSFPVKKDYNNVFILAVSKEGKGKKTEISEYNKIGRGGKGIININAEEVIFSDCVTQDDEIILITKQGYLRRLPVIEIPTLGRNTSGVILFRPYEGDELSCGVKIEKDFKN